VTEHYDVVIVGAGHGGAQLALSLRQLKYTGSILLVGEEPHPPYERPPLSKEYLVREKTFERLLIRPESFWAQRDIVLRLNTRVVLVHSEVRAIESADGARFGYGRLVWAAGARPRVLNVPGANLTGISGCGFPGCILTLDQTSPITSTDVRGSHICRFARGDRVRLESVQNANDLAAVVAREIHGNGHDYAAIPWFWSNQYDLRLQTVGLSAGHDTAVLRGDPRAALFL